MVECINMIQDTGGTRPGMQGPRQSQHGIDSMYTETKQFKLHSQARFAEHGKLRVFRAL